MSCSENCEPCKARHGFICHGDFITTGEWASLVDHFDIHGVSFNQKVESVISLLDVSTLQIIKVLVCESNRWDYTTNMEIVYLLDEIIKSKLSTDNKNYFPGDDAL